MNLVMGHKFFGDVANAHSINNRPARGQRIVV